MRKYVYVVEIHTHKMGVLEILTKTREIARRTSDLFKKNGKKTVIKQIKLTEENVKVVR